MAALELYQAGKVDRILVSGDHGQSKYAESTPCANGFWHIACQTKTYRGSNSKLGFGAGFGSTIDFSPDMDASLSPELVVSFGECCTYLTVSYF